MALDLTPEQLQETLKYFTLSSDRTNQMTKTHNDLDAILQLLQEKEKDLELAAKIGQSLLERNKSLMHKTETMEKYLSEHSDREEQLRHDIVRKNDLLQKFLKDQEDLLLEADNRSEDEAKSSESASLVRDDSFGTLQDKCHVLEQQNTRFILEALHLKEQTATEELKERQLVADCVQQLLDAKDQITALTDDIGRKAEDNIRQQEEISQLIDTVVDLQRRHTQLSEDNEELQSLLSTSQVGQDELKSQIADLQEKYHECFEILMENQQEMRSLNRKITTPHPKHSSPAANLDGKDSIALEIEQSIKRDMATIQEKRQNLARVLQTVHNINVSKGKKPKKVTRPTASKNVQSSSGFKFNPITDLPRNTSESSLDGADDASSASGFDSRYSYTRRSFKKPEKLQIVKPIKGSLTLQQWKKLASPTMNLEQERPGVHVKGDLQTTSDGKHSKEHSDVSDMSEVDTDDDQPIQMRIRSTTQEDVTPIAMDEKAQKHRREPPTTLTLTSLVHEKGIHAGSRRGSATAGILSQLLNSPSVTTSGKSSVGQVLAEVLQKASEEASVKEPRRAESLRNLANYFSEKEKEGKNGPEAIPEDDSPPVTPPNTLSMLSVAGGSSNIGGGILTRLLAGSSGINVSMSNPRPIATVAGTSSTSTTFSTSVGPLNPSGFGRTSSGTNLKQLDSSGLDPKRRSLDVTESGYRGNFSSEVPNSSLPTLRRRASSGDLESMSSSNDLVGSYNNLGLGNRLQRSNSSGNLNDLTQNAQTPVSGGIFGRLTRRPSLGSLTDLVQRSHIGAVPVPPPGRMERASSIDLGLAARPGQSPPSPSHFDASGSFFSGQQPFQGPSKGLFSGTRLSSLAGVRGMWSQKPSSSTSGGTPSQVLSTQKSEERLEKINKAFAFEDFGGMGLMSFFGSKKSSQN
ncbi:uncharacterized protein LOC116289319 [Actinia tenebrosa]|uniref:Uncharacterized protein LOC116289319 n=1 Tax=Actinia tenebrosa TaxID=6105 RepID=A0A6P8HHI2_ACTTE|nr:uncharacterized protein LOC116289319 [Actinia tenebrosa]